MGRKIPVVCQRTHEHPIDMVGAGGRMTELLSRLREAEVGANEIDFFINDLDDTARRRMTAYMLAGAPKEMTHIDTARDILWNTFVAPTDIETAFGVTYTPVQKRALSVVPFPSHVLQSVREKAILFPGFPLAHDVLCEQHVTQRLTKQSKGIFHTMQLRWYLVSNGVYRTADWTSYNVTPHKALERLKSQSGVQLATASQLIFLHRLLINLSKKPVIDTASNLHLICDIPENPPLKAGIYREGNEIDLRMKLVADQNRNIGLAVEYLPAH